MYIQQWEGMWDAASPDASHRHDTDRPSWWEKARRVAAFILRQLTEVCNLCRPMTRKSWWVKNTHQ